MLRVAPQLRRYSEAELVGLIRDGLAVVRDETIVPASSGAVAIANTFEGGSNGVGITTGNSGGSSGDAFTDISSTAPTFSSAQAAHGSLGMEIALPGVSTNISAGWSGLGPITTDGWTRTYFYMAALPNANYRVVIYRTSAPGTSLVVQLNTSGQIRCLNAASAAIPGLAGTTALATGQWWRVEARVLPNATTGTAEWRLYDADSTTETESKSDTALNTGADLDGAWFAPGNSTTPTSQTFYHDDVAWSDVGWIGPSGGGVTHPNRNYIWLP